MDEAAGRGWPGFRIELRIAITVTQAVVGIKSRTNW